MLSFDYLVRIQVLSTLTENIEGFRSSEEIQVRFYLIIEIKHQMITIKLYYYKRLPNSILH